MKIFKTIVLTLLSISALVLLAGVIKFNFIDAPFVGDPAVYTSNTGATLEAHRKADGSIQLSFMAVDGDYLKAFIAQPTFTARPTLSASGSRYESDDGRFVFWSKGHEATIFGHNDEVIFHGSSAKASSIAVPDENPGETIYFSASSASWQDHNGICHTCTPENGFSADGATGTIVWRELKLTLYNDALEIPSTEEVREFFQSQYAEASGYYPVHVEQLDTGAFIVQVAVPNELRNIDFFDPQGALLATYDALQH